MAKIIMTSVAIAGSGEASDETIAGLLNDQLPQKLGGVYRPNRMPRHLRSLHSARAWLESPDVLDEHGTIGTDDIIESLLSRRKGDGTKENPGGDVLELYVLWPEEPSEDELKLVKDAFASGIRVRNLSAMFKDLDPDEIFPPEPEATPAEAAADDAVEQLGIEDKVPLTREQIDAAFQSVAGGALLEALDAFVTEVARRVFREERGTGTPDPKMVINAVAAKLSEPPFDPPFVPEKTDGPIGSAEKEPGKVKYFYDPKNDRYRVAKFRPKTGEETVYLDEEEIGTVVRAGLVSD